MDWRGIAEETSTLQDSDGPIATQNRHQTATKIGPSLNAVIGVEVPIGGGEVAVSVPDGFLPVRVINAVKHQPVPRAFVTWTIEGGGRSEATATIIGDALLEGVATKPGILR
jgi:hypothetical protein